MENNSQFRQLILKLGNSLTKQDTQGLNLLLDLPFKELNGPIESLTYLLQKQNLSPTNKEGLENALRSIGRYDLAKELENFKSKNINECNRYWTNEKDQKNQKKDDSKTSAPIKQTSEEDDSFLSINTTLDESVYVMESNQVNKCLVFYNDFPNKYFDNPPTIPENKHLADVHQLYLTFNWLGFNVERHHNSSREFLLETMRKYLIDEESNLSCLVTFIITCGKNGLICSADKKVISIKEDIIDFIGSDKCNNSIGIPKLFFIEGSEPPESLKKLCHREICESSSSMNDQSKNVIAAERDIFIYSSKISTAVPQSKGNGSLFIQRLCRSLQKHAKSIHFYEILMKVNNYVDKKMEKEDTQPLQGVYDINTLKKKIKFTPAEESVETFEKRLVMQDQNI